MGELKSEGSNVTRHQQSSMMTEQMMFADGETVFLFADLRFHEEHIINKVLSFVNVFANNT